MTVHRRHALHHSTRHEISFLSQRNSNPGDRCFADGHGYLRALVANGLLVPGQVAHESRLIGPIEVPTTEKASPNHRPTSRIGHKSIPLCPWGNSRVHLSNPRLRSTRRLIRPLDPPPDTQGFYSRDRIKRLLVRRHPSTSTLPKRRGSLANASGLSPWPSSLWRFHLVAKAARFSSARVPQNSEPRAETCEVSLPEHPLATSCSLHPRTSDSRFAYHHLPSRRPGSSRTIHTFRETRGTRMLGTESSLNWSFDPSHQACASNFVFSCSIPPLGVFRKQWWSPTFRRRTVSPSDGSSKFNMLPLADPLLWGNAPLPSAV